MQKKEDDYFLVTLNFYLLVIIQLDEDEQQCGEAP